MTSSNHHGTSRRRGGIAAGAVVAALLAAAGGAARAEDGADRLGDAIEIRRLEVDPDARLEDANGVGLDLGYRLGRVAADKALTLVARVNEQGRPVQSLAWSAALRDRNDGSLHGKKQLVTVPRGSWREASLFIPFYAMKLSPGPHRIEVKLEAVVDAGSCKTGERPRLIAIVGEDRAQVSLTKPAYSMVQVLVSRIAVIGGHADASIWPWRARPDLRWRLRVQAGAGGVMHESEVRDDTTVASWSTYSRRFPLSQGDLLTIAVLDKDVMGHDEMGSVKLSLDELLALGPSSHVKAGGKVRDLVVGVKAR